MKITIKAARVNAGLTQREAAKLLGIGYNTIINWEKGVTSPKMDDVARMSEIYHWPVELFNFSNEVCAK